MQFVLQGRQRVRSGLRSLHCSGADRIRLEHNKSPERVCEKGDKRERFACFPRRTWKHAFVRFLFGREQGSAGLGCAVEPGDF